jgi:hypothetical protein
VVERLTTTEDSTQSRDLSVVIVMPDTDGEIGRVLTDFEEVLLHLVDTEDSEDIPERRCVARETIDAVGRLSSCVLELERRHQAVQPVAPDGRFELIPLLFVEVSPRDLARVVAALQELAAVVPSDEYQIVADEMVAASRPARRRAEWVSELGRLESLLRLPHDDDAHLLHAVLGWDGDELDDRPVRVVLAAGEYAAYRRVTERIMATWYRDDCFAPFLYRGIG